MENRVFYSWQSDLPKDTNRYFIEECIKRALKELNASKTFDIEFAIDRDTMDVSGTPDIASTVFSKIEKSKLFIADVSIINSDYSKRKTPNPNVLIELGYAAKVLGWEKIICIFNMDFGSYDDLPFDIKFRRPLRYSLNGKAKTEERNKIVEIIKNNICSLDSKGLLSIKEPHSYMVLESSNFYNQVEEVTKRILSERKLQEKYCYSDNNFIIEVWDDLMYRIENNEPSKETDIEYHVSIEFNDDTYSYKEYTNQTCTVFFQFVEKFKQINFSNNKVYTVYEIISHGYSPSKKRDYNGLMSEVIKRLSNHSDFR
ncbi:hypothetical protein H1S01_17555 [Heliobacterium chlorum]|uniref:CD-NTase-associated protein 12/Pycsar effector protein TIR domain-containing protein n=1 Tax=Heliobacterium chlorum TaxID=2698 RepID=A0ABR7T7T1_HELCL|nr:hypothetical protein [Heliobacterium chlorum]MBC9786267.1 hypothetical protein [Heliobacterium chlorum]